ncbi:unnamed protein product, partial [Closterium sp. NIES-53]
PRGHSRVVESSTYQTSPILIANNAIHVPIPWQYPELCGMTGAAATEAPSGIHKLPEFLPAAYASNNPDSTTLVAVYPSALQYPKLCGMTGTAATEADEFESIYKLAVAEVPTNRPLQRK